MSATQPQTQPDSGIDYSRNPFQHYDPSDASQDYTTWRQPLNNWFTTVLGPIDDAANLRPPATDYVQIEVNGKPTVIQWIDTTMRNYGDALSAFIRASEIGAEAGEADNPLATLEDRAEAALAMRFDLQYQDEVVAGDLLEEIKRHLTYRGMCFEQHIPLSDPESIELDGLRIRSDVVDVFDAAWRLHVGNRLDQFIVQKRRTLSELPPSWQKAVEIQDWTTDDVLYEYMDRYNHAAVYGQTVVKKLTPHGYVDSMGRPAVPVTMYIHTPDYQRQGGIAPQPSGVSQRAIRVGIPVVFALLTEHQKRSRALTLAMHAARTGSVPLIVVKGLVQNRIDEEAEIDFENGVLELNDTPSANAQFMVPPNAAPALQALITAINQDLAAASVAPNILQGQTQENVPGVSQNGMTSWARAKAESLSLTLSRGLTDRATMRIGIYKQILVAPTTRQFAYDNGQDMKLARGDNSPLANDGITLAMGGLEVDNLTFANIRRVAIHVVANNRMPVEQEYQLGITAAGAKTASGVPLFSVTEIREKFFHDTDPWISQRDAILEQQASNPQSPWGQCQVIRAMIDSPASELTPQQQKGFMDQYKRLAPIAIQASINAAIAALQNPQGQGGQQQGGPPQQQGMGGPPPGPPDQSQMGGPPPANVTPFPPQPGMGGPPMMAPPQGPPDMFPPPGGPGPNFPAPDQGPPPPWLQQPMLPAGPPALANPLGA